jgi:hypothetical protein
MQTLKATGLHRKSGERSGEISVWMLFLGSVLQAKSPDLKSETWAFS